MNLDNQCISPPPLTDDQINDVLDGEADMETQAHAEKCPYCARRVEMAGAVESYLHKHLYRWNCPSPAMLRDFHFELLNPEDKTVVEKHLEHCPRCREDLEQLEDFLAEEEPIAEKVEWESIMPTQARYPPAFRPDAIIATFQPDAAQTYRGKTEQYRGGAPVLRGDAPEMLMFNTESKDTIFLEVNPVGGHILLTGGLVVVDEPDEWQGAIVEIWREQALESATILDDDGNFKYTVHENGVIQIRIIAERGKNIVVSDIVVEI